MKVHNIEGKETSKTVDLNEAIFGVDPNDHCIYLDVKWYLANKRQGTHKSKERAEITGSTKKLKKQKGTGTARAGSIKSPLFRGGGTAFGPSPRDYGFKLNKKVRRVARKSALAYKAKNDALIVVEDFNFEAPKTKQFETILKNLGIVSEKSLFLLPARNGNVEKSAQNIPNTEVMVANTFSSYEILRANKLVVTESALKELDSYLDK